MKSVTLRDSIALSDVIASDVIASDVREREQLSGSRPRTDGRDEGATLSFRRRRRRRRRRSTPVGIGAEFGQFFSIRSVVLVVAVVALVGSASATPADDADGDTQSEARTRPLRS